MLLLLTQGGGGGGGKKFWRPDDIIFGLFLRIQIYILIKILWSISKSGQYFITILYSRLFQKSNTFFFMVADYSIFLQYILIQENFKFGNLFNFYQAGYSFTCHRQNLNTKPTLIDFSGPRYCQPPSSAQCNHHSRWVLHKYCIAHCTPHPWPQPGTQLQI